MPEPGNNNRKPYAGTARRLLLAFDIGTTFSGISYSILDPGQIPEIRPVTRYPSQEQVGGDSKIPTVIYYDSSGEPVAIGAETLREGIETDAEEEGWKIARWFKLHLRPREAINAAEEEPVPPLPLDKSVIEVFTDFMAYLHQCAKAYIQDTHGERLWNSLQGDILYVLTHPNGWGGRQQASMRRAASLAGLVPNTPAGGARVMFVTEGEASLHFCLSNGLNLEDAGNRGVLIVDAGGGTIDVTAYRRRADGSFTENSIPQCYFHGGAYVTMRAKTWFHNLLDGSRFEPDVETLTTRFDRGTKHVFRRVEDQHIQFASHRERDPALGIRSGRLTIPGADIAGFFAPSIDCIVDCIQRQRVAAHIPIKNVFLVGGFSASQWLVEKVRERIQPLGITVSRPDTHVNKAVSNGAVSFYLDSLVTSRVSRATYGIEVWHEYDPRDLEHVARGHLVKVHPATAQPALYDLFDVILPKNTEVAATKEFRRHFRFSTKHRHELLERTIPILGYCGASENPKWINDEPQMYPPLCRVTADTSGIHPRTKRTAAGQHYYEIEYDVVLQFGLTELKAQIAYKINGVERRGPASVIFAR
ncbi:hypothetical protein DFP72DRAFT_1174069 [Ephemerocybe angulata]|uniref:Uncharacterized protein n=1 Tax=Ephemerocybe angulata TaxID=980116 RepID=A0A8H6HLI3_9AGAR|nr:hypothetical protein DFP72DRAFT_1174069 [Tulosesus angulatus]